MLYVCFLDAQKAFDSVWHDGLFYKLHNAGVSDILLKSFINMYDNMNSHVMHQGHTSNWFKVSQGTKQGGVSSPFMYISYIDELIRELVSSPDGLVLYDENCCSPTVADDMILISFSRNGLLNMMNTCYRYSQKWRYTYNSTKCNVIVFNESKSDYTNSNRSWSLGEEIVHECEQYTHLGIICNKYMNLYINASEASNTVRGTFLGLIHSGINKHGFHPLTSKRIYECVVLPSDVSCGTSWLPSDVDILKRAHRFCVKLMQDIPRLTKTDIALNTIGCLPI